LKKSPVRASTFYQVMHPATASFTARALKIKAKLAVAF